MRVLVTGGAGFIGSHLCEKLLGLGHDVTCFDDFNKFYDPGVKRDNIFGCEGNEAFHLIEGNLLEGPRVRSLFSAEPFDAVVHLAAMPGSRASIQNPLQVEEVNVRGTLDLLQHCRESNVGKFVLASSYAVYGLGVPSPLKETHGPGRLVSPFAATKLAAEALCQVYHQLYGIAVSVLRFFTVYGPRQRPDMAVHRFMRSGLEGKTIKRFGDGSSVRDLIFVDDAVELTVRAMEKCEGHDVYNVGSGTGVTVAELLQRVTNILGVDLQIEENEPAPGDLGTAVADMSKSRLKLGYKPEVKLDDGLAAFLDWLKRQKGAEGERKSYSGLRREAIEKVGDNPEGENEGT